MTVALAAVACSDDTPDQTATGDTGEQTETGASQGTTTSEPPTDTTAPDTGSADEHTLTITPA